MSRAYLVYFVMAAMLAGGLWLVITLGESLRAPDDLSGNWTVHWEQPPPGFSPKGKMHVDQSGRFFTIKFEQGPTLSLKLNERYSGAREGRHLSMTLTGENCTLACTGSIAGSPRRADDLRLELRDPTHAGTFAGSAARVTDSVAAGASPAPGLPAPPAKTADAR
jgi:hypothetical protein